MKTYRYDILGAYTAKGITKHPNDHMTDLGYKVLEFTSNKDQGCFIFKVEKEIKNTPAYLVELTTENN